MDITENEVLINEVAQSLDITLSTEISMEDFIDKLTGYLDYLIEKDFERLVNILYKVDVNEARLKQMLQADSDQNACVIIAKLIIYRQRQKIESRKKFTSNNVSEEEKWNG